MLWLTVGWRPVKKAKKSPRKISCSSSRLEGTYACELYFRRFDRTFGFGEAVADFGYIRSSDGFHRIDKRVDVERTDENDWTEEAN